MAESTLLQACITAHREAVTRVIAISDNMTNDQANFRPGPKKWSVCECVEHLNQGLKAYVKSLGPAIEAARAAGKTGTEPYGRGTFAGRFIIKFLKKGPGKRAPAPKVFRPDSSRLDIKDVVANFRRNAEELSELADAADGLKLGHIKIATPVGKLIRVSLAQAFELHTLHTPRHLAQAERVKLAEGYPG